MKRIVKEKLYEYDYEYKHEEEIPSENIENIPKSKSKKKGYHTNIEKDTINNELFRKVLYTGSNLQLVIMSLNEDENIGMEVHENDQFFRFESGKGEVIVNNTTYDVSSDDIVIIPAGAKHDIINTGRKPLKFYTIYAPPHHKDKTLHISKEDAEIHDHEFDKKTSE